MDQDVKNSLANKLGWLMYANAELGAVNERLLATLQQQQAKIAELEAKIAAKDEPQPHGGRFASDDNGADVGGGGGNPPGAGGNGA